eukprot:Platyproteum_vivax@DN1675_c0_g1_i1.p1
MANKLHVVARYRKRHTLSAVVVEPPHETSLRRRTYTEIPDHQAKPPKAATPIPSRQWAMSRAYFPNGTACLLAINFLRQLSKVKTFEVAATDSRWQMVPHQLITMWHHYKIDSADMAVDLAACIYYLSVSANKRPAVFEDAALRSPAFFHVQIIWFLAYLSHVYHQDYNIGLADWAEHLSYRTYFVEKQPSENRLHLVNVYVLALLEKVCEYDLRVDPADMNALLSRLSAPL